jgi:hypothetical protein
VSGKEEERKSRQELCQAGVTEVDGAVGDLVDLPADGHRLHFERDHDEETRQSEGNEIRMRKRSTPSQPRIFCSQHSSRTHSRLIIEAT